MCNNSQSPIITVILVTMDFTLLYPLRLYLNLFNPSGFRFYALEILLETYVLEFLEQIAVHF